MKKRRAKRIQKSQQITDEEKDLLDLMANLIVEIILYKKDNPEFDNDIETKNKTK